MNVSFRPLFVDHAIDSHPESKEMIKTEEIKEEFMEIPLDLPEISYFETDDEESKPLKRKNSETSDEEYVPKGLKKPKKAKNCQREIIATKELEVEEDIEGDHFWIFVHF